MRAIKRSLLLLFLALGAIGAHADEIDLDKVIVTQQTGSFGRPEVDAASEDCLESTSQSITAAEIERLGPDRYRPNWDYVYGLTRAVAGSSASSASKPLWFLFTIPVDTALLPFAVVGALAG